MSDINIETFEPGDAGSFVEDKGVIPFKAHPKAPEGTAWGGPREVAAAEVSDLRVMCTWYDSENADVKSAYKLPHHRARDKYTVWRGVSAAMGALFGARGGVRVPAGDRRGIFGHLSRHYGQFDKPVPEFREFEIISNCIAELAVRGIMTSFAES